MSKSTFIYHERQESLLCGQHSLNNLLQQQAFSPDQLAEIAHQLDQLELNYMAKGDGGVNSKDYLKRLQEGSYNIDPSGNFSIEVLKSALLSRFNMNLVNSLNEEIRNKEITNWKGFILNKQSHWFTIRKISQRFWNLNSILEKPEQISHFQLASFVEQMRKEGYSVFCVLENDLLTDCHDEKELEMRGLPEFWWKEDDLLNGTGKKGYKNHWNQNLGTGMRLDGKSTAGGTSGSSNNGGGMSIEGLTEEEQIQLAMAASLQPEANVMSIATTSTMDIVELTSEPEASNPNAVRIQFRLPNNKRLMRRFLKNDSVAMVLAYVKDECDVQDVDSLDIRAGFPPKDLMAFMEKSIEEAKLANESIQCRFK
ncbi:Josephin-domain-containing protein [Chaetoceros tenuissimus]|uniref:ubiquitinyl hydrolase 1 n=1 Tax=Chaetoceros tenuissimus TaxID=426638 RepID=A0AAD3HAZ7_9STRA|nr:Josephin-domain-containing protein [Chaetoceros tenuissimus]